MGMNTYPRVVELLNEHISAKISRNEFCRVTGINRNSVDRYRAGLGCPIHETLVKMAKYFKVSVGHLKGNYDDNDIDYKIDKALGLEPDEALEKARNQNIDILIELLPGLENSQLDQIYKLIISLKKTDPK